MNIGEVSERARLTAKTIRYYEDIGLIRPLRDTNGYRAFRDSDLHKLAFLGQARGWDFPLISAGRCWRYMKTTNAPVRM